MSPIVTVPKKNGKIQKCQDFRKLNVVIKKHHFPLSFTNSMVNVAMRHECYSFLDGFSKYSEFSIVVENRLKTTFTMYWGTYAYQRMFFGLCNALVTFQRIMVTAFYYHRNILRWLLCF